MRDPYLYPHTDILKNRANIRDREILEKLEGDLTASRLADLASNISVSRFDFAELCMVHNYIFQDIYDWAGKPRIKNIDKSERALGGLSVKYSDYFDIARDAEQVLADMNHYAWDKASFDETVRNYSRYMADLWKVHPFREGNTRTVVTFCNLFMYSRGHTVNMDLYKDNAEYVRTALVAASAYFHDLGDRRQPEYLERIVADSLKDGWKDKERSSVLGKLKINQARLSKERGENIQKNVDTQKQHKNIDVEK